MLTFTICADTVDEMRDAFSHFVNPTERAPTPVLTANAAEVHYALEERDLQKVTSHRDELIDQVRDLTHARDEAESQAETYGEHLKAITVAFAKAQNLDSRQIAAIEAAENLLTHSHTVA